ncbi:hypothetical protein [Vibrio brasiliensis]|uniref:hypothetical protein n=1 Tax=Vibrio brasiliensis TaxID=170652 RepID=UPI001EFE329F|nr:hypothetical protein [Vibrio brasiliensis]MCG9727743.1 hypothetical protein [Vibrio brasiliensis]
MTENNKRRYRTISLKEIKKENKFYIPHVDAINNLHNIYLVTEISRNAIQEHREDLKDQDDKFVPLEFPDIDGSLKSTPKRRAKTVKILKNAVRHDLYSNSLISSVSATEVYLEKVVELCLLNDPRRLSHSIKKQSKKGKLSEPEIEVKIDDSTIPLRNLLEAQNLEDLYKNVIRDKLHQLMYASPADYFGYLKNALGIELDQDMINTYVEIKATRDLLTHGQGYVNDVYIQKAGQQARVTDTKQRIPLPPEYFASSIGTMKKLVGDIYKLASKEFLGVTHFKDLYPPRRPTN